MEMKPCENSSNIARHGYDAATNELHIEFKSGSHYRYPDVPVDVAFEFMNAGVSGGGDISFSISGITIRGSGNGCRMICWRRGEGRFG